MVYLSLGLALPQLKDDGHPFGPQHLSQVPRSRPAAVLQHQPRVESHGTLLVQVGGQGNAVTSLSCVKWKFAACGPAAAGLA